MSVVANTYNTGVCVILEIWISFPHKKGTNTKLQQQKN